MTASSNSDLEVFASALCFLFNSFYFSLIQAHSLYADFMQSLGDRHFNTCELIPRYVEDFMWIRADQYPSFDCSAPSSFSFNRSSLFPHACIGPALSATDMDSGSQLHHASAAIWFVSPESLRRGGPEALFLSLLHSHSHTIMDSRSIAAT